MVKKNNQGAANDGARRDLYTYSGCSLTPSAGEDQDDKKNPGRTKPF